MTIKERQAKIPRPWRRVVLAIVVASGFFALLFDYMRREEGPIALDWQQPWGKTTLWIILGLVTLAVGLYISYLQKKD